MKCSIMLHFIWVFTVCKSTCLGVSLNTKGYYRDYTCFSMHLYLLGSRGGLFEYQAARSSVNNSLGTWQASVNAMNQT